MIEASHLTKRYGSYVAVEDLSFTVDKGAVYGFLGPNGAGKSTTMNILAGCLAASAGTVVINGYDLFDQPIQARRQVGYLPEQPPLYMGMTTREYLAFVARAKGVPVRDLDKHLERVMTVTGTQQVERRLIRNLSKGYRQRVGIAQAILGEPQVVILDEPTVGLDPLQIVEIRQLIRSLREDHTVLFSSHILSEVQTVCDQILVIHQGKLVASGRAEDLERQLSGQSIYQITAMAQPEQVRQTLEALEEVKEITVQEDGSGRTSAQVTVLDQSRQMDEKISFAFRDRNIPVLRLEREQASLEEVFLALTSGQPQAESAEQRTRGRRRKNGT